MEDEDDCGNNILTIEKPHRWRFIDIDIPDSEFGEDDQPHHAPVRSIRD